MSTPIERIAGYACEVNEDQWRELVKVADEVGINVDGISRKDGTMNGRYKEAGYDEIKSHLMTDTGFKTLIPYPDFLAKLKGEEKWEPKNGEEVEIEIDGKWYEREYIGVRHQMHFVWSPNKSQGWVEHYGDNRIRPLRPTITRAEAERKLKELGVIARIVD